MDRNAEDWLDAGTLSVALRKESVDRNVSWTAPSRLLRRVALRKESVDRNLVSSQRLSISCCRSPQGERG